MIANTEREESYVLLADSLDGNKITAEYLAHINSVVNNEQNPVTYLGIDPGNATGITGYDEKFYLQFSLTLKPEDVGVFLDNFYHLKTVVYEGFALFPNKAKQQIYSKMTTSQVIGRIKTISELRGFEVVEQQSTIKNTGYKYLGKKPLPKSNPQNHTMDAHVHFMYWAISKGKLKACVNPNSGKVEYAPNVVSEPKD